jgi:UDP-2-acetamido-3-amino-2,3-dideoxy-glucuronate N-acetyltransferase
MNYHIHETSIVDNNVEIGDGTKIWHWVHVCSGAKIGKNCVLGQNVYIGPNVIIGDNVKIQNNVSVYEGVEIGNNVFLGPSCVFTNDKYPKSSGVWNLVKTKLLDGCSIGANSTIICGVTIGENALVGAGCVVTKDIPSDVTVVGNPARILKVIK